jgi:Cu2+-exporting ATPase
LNFDWSFPGSQWIAPVLGTAIYFYGSKPFLTGGIDEARKRQPGMMLLIALAITVAFASSVVSLTNALDLTFWWELASLIVIMLLGHWQEMKAIGQAQGALAELLPTMPNASQTPATPKPSRSPTSSSAIDCSCVPAAGSPRTARSSSGPSR